MQNICIVIPVYCEEKNLIVLYNKLQDVISKIKGYDWRYVFVNDGSTDSSLDVLRVIAKENSKVTVLDLSRNFGKEVAITAGVHEAKNSDAVICMDADLQHPPQLITTLVEEWEKGAEIVATIRRSSRNQPLIRKWGSHLYYWIMSKISGLDMVSQSTDYRLFDRKVVESFCLITERERMFRGILDWMGYIKVYIEFSADARAEGGAGYTYSKLWRLAINSITSFSLWPLRITGYLGIVITTCSGLLLLWMLGSNFYHSSVIYTPLAVVAVGNTFLIGIVLMAIGLIAIYIGKIHTEVVNRPLYIVREKLNTGSGN